MSGRDQDSDQGGYPEAMLALMTSNHERYVRLLDEHDLQKEATEPPSTAQHNNPFLSFKNFVDTGLASLVEHFHNLPVNAKELSSKKQDVREQERDKKRGTWKRWTGLDESSDYARMVSERWPEMRREATDSTLLLLKQARDRNAHVAPERVAALYRDDVTRLHTPTPIWSEGGSIGWHPRPKQHLPADTPMSAVGWPERWLSVRWFKENPYSPFTLEVQGPNAVPDPRWRHAFEDLLNATLDKPMSSREQIGQRTPHSKPQSTSTGPGLDWMLSLQCRGILPPQLPRLHEWTEGLGPDVANPVTVLDELLKGEHTRRSLYQASYPAQVDFDALVHEVATPAPTTEAVQEPQTELEMYEAKSEPVVDYRTEKSLLGSKPEPHIADICQPQALGDAGDALWDALLDGDATKAAQCLSSWYNIHGDVADLLGEVRNNWRIMCDESWMSTFNEALRKSELPETDSWKQSARKRYDQDLKERLFQEREALGLNDRDQRGEMSAMTRDSSTQTMPTSPSALMVDVLSSLTTTQTTRLPDGTVTTKVVLKQRFADGREETEEKVHICHEPSPQQADRTEAMSDQPKKGWFWT